MADYRHRKNILVGQNVVIEEGVILGNNIKIYNDVIIRRGSMIGDNCILGCPEDGGCQGDGVVDTFEPAFMENDFILGYPLQSREIPKNRVTEIGEAVKVRNGTIIYTGTRIGNNSAIGHCVVIRKNNWLGQNFYIGAYSLINENSTIGDYVGIQAGSLIAAESHIGDYTFIGPWFISVDKAFSPPHLEPGPFPRGLTTDQYVRIAAGVTVGPGIHFGEGCIVAANSLVTENVPPFTLVMGAPARVIREVPHEEIFLHPSFTKG